MPDFIWIIIVFVVMIVGIIGSILPALPGTPLTFMGLLIYKFCPIGETLSWWWIAIGSFLTLLSLVTGYFIPVLAAKKFGGSKYGVIGVTIGVFSGFFLPYGFIYGPFLGALIGELIYDFMNKQGAIKASLGAFLGFIVSMGINIIICGIIITIFLVHLTFSYFLHN